MSFKLHLCFWPHPKVKRNIAENCVIQEYYGELCENVVQSCRGGSKWPAGGDFLSLS